MIRWAPVLLQPIPGSDERMVIAIAAVAEDEARCMQTIDPSIVAAVFREDRKYVAEIVQLTIRSVREHLTYNRSLSAWPPPVEGVFLGTEQQTVSSDIDEVVRLAGAMCTVFHGERCKPQAKTPRRRRWTEEVIAAILGENEGLRNHLTVRVPIGWHDAPAHFTFLNQSFAANLVTFSNSDLKGRIQQARADLWSLSLLVDGPYIFHPERRELLAGVEYSGEPADVKVREAIDEITDEAARREVIVTEFQTPREVAQHILAHAVA